MNEFGSPRRQSSGSKGFGWLIGLVAVVAIAAAAFFFWKGSEDGELSSAAMQDSDSTQSSVDLSTIDTGIPASELEVGETTGVKFKVGDQRFKAVGTLDAATSAGVNQVVELTYADLAANEIAVDADAQPKAWAASLPVAVQAMSSLMEFGELEVTDDATILTGSIPNEAYQEELEKILSEEAGFPPLQNNAELNLKAFPELVITDVDGDVTVSANLPTQEMVDQISAKSLLVWGEDTNLEIELDPTTFVDFGWARYEVLVAGLADFQNYEAGSRLGSPYAILNEGLNFNTNATQLSPESQQNLVGLLPVMLASRQTILIEGHTDSVGSDESNQVLSEARAATVAQTLQQATNGLLPESRFEVVGFGEADPIASNDTEQGREKNRRVKISITEIS